MAESGETVKMVVIDGVRYRPEDAPKSGSDAGHKMRKPATKATSASESDSK